MDKTSNAIFNSQIGSGSRNLVALRVFAAGPRQLGHAHRSTICIGTEASSNASSSNRSRRRPATTSWKPACPSATAVARPTRRGARNKCSFHVVVGVPRLVRSLYVRYSVTVLLRMLCKLLLYTLSSGTRRFFIPLEKRNSGANLKNG